MLLSNYIIFAVCSTLVYGAFAAHYSSVCQETEENVGAPPPLMPKSYWMAVSAQILTSRQTLDIWEYFDEDAKKGAVITAALNGSSRYQIITDYLNDQHIIVDMNRMAAFDNCNVKDVNMRNGEFLLTTDSGTNRLVVPYRAFSIGSTSIKKENKGDSVVNGVSVTTFYSCYYWKEADASLKINWLFKNNWSPALGTVTQPYLLTIEGQFNANKQTINVRYEVSQYRGGLTGDEIHAPLFRDALIPLAGVYCDSKYGSSTKLGNLPDRFSMDIEKEDLILKATYYIHESYDFGGNVSLMEYDPDILSSQDSMRYGSGRLLIVHDYSREIAYIRNLRLGNCTYESIPPLLWDSAKTGDKSRMRTPEEFFDLDTPNYRYKGQKKFRDINTDVFIAYRKDYPKSDPSDSTFEWYFANKTVMNNLGERTFVRVPVGLYFRAKETFYNVLLNIYNFDDSVKSYSVYDMSKCFENHQSVHVRMEFLAPESWDLDFVKGNKQAFINAFVQAFANAGQISVLRLFDIDVSVNEDAQSITVELTVWERSPKQADVKIKEISLDAAMEKVKSSVSRQEFGLNVVVGDYAQNFASKSFAFIDERIDRKTIYNNGYSIGAMIGISIAAIAIGFSAGIAIMYFVKWRRSLADSFSHQQFT